MLTTVEVLLNYGLAALTVEEIKTGLINKTYLVKTMTGGFILQKLHPIYDQRTILNVAGVGKFLNERGLTAPLVWRTAKGAWGLEDDGQYWRLSTFIPGRILERASNSHLAYEAGKILGRFHYLMDNYPGVLHEARRPHDSLEHWKALLGVLPHRLEPTIQKLWESIADLSHLFLPAGLKIAFTHGDPKISNIVFEEETDRAKALIDLDGCNKQNSLLVELGDAFRSWCGDKEDIFPNCFDLEKFRAGWSGYLEEAETILMSEEKALLVQGIKLIILELASRFLRDYYEDRYFGWDPQSYPSRSAHNLARAQGQVSLYLDLVQKQAEIEKIVRGG